jgi:predicted dehydrogenase
MRSKLHYDWHWVWDTGNGDVGNQGIHQMDIARWFLGETALSPAVISAGGRLGYVDDGETPNSLIVFHDYKKAPLIFEVRGLPQGTGIEKMDAYHGASVGVLIECEGGHVLVPDYNSATAFDKEGKQINKWSGSDNHYANFFKAVRSRKHEELNADISEGHISSALCHTGNISYRLGQGKSADAVREKIKSERDGAATYDRMITHLQANGVDLKTSKIVQGEYLKMDPAKERFTNSGSANKLLTREYRKPFVVPEKV